jgi:hypothetical protein
VPSITKEPPTTKKKVPRKSGLGPVWITTEEAYELAGMTRSSFRNRRKEGHFKSHKTPSVYGLRFIYDEVLEDAANFWAGGKPNHEPDTFLPHRRDINV